MRHFAHMLSGPSGIEDSLISKLDPRAKLLFVIVATLSLFVGAGWIDLLVWAGVAAVAQAVSDIPVRRFLAQMRGFLWLIVLAFVLQMLFLARPDEPFWRLWDFDMLMFKLERAAFFTFRLFLFIFYSALLMSSTSPIELADALERLFKPLKRLKVPVHEIAMMASIAVRFIPTVSEEGQKIYKAQLARGARFQGGLLQRVRATVPLIVPLLFATVRRAEELALAMEARGYNSRARRTSYSQLIWGWRETLILLVALAVTVITKPMY
ncbi:MAG: energy-coupling factor transporter transmembrane component T [candidate division KSB1 bacterium]|nr:energy-coupling factor transporter transmembrane component T [candidate division KSB1 bacterium]MDQ7066049.1 energy-coupling factor transporter transmembrane component T [candidate division KSB1 bacterium]